MKVPPGTSTVSPFELEVSALLLFAIDDPVAFEEDDELPTAGEHGGHLEILTLLVVSSDGGQEIHVEGGVHGAERGSARTSGFL